MGLVQFSPSLFLSVLKRQASYGTPSYDQNGGKPEQNLQFNVILETVGQFKIESEKNVEVEG